MNRILKTILPAAAILVGHIAAGQSMQFLAVSSGARETGAGGATVASMEAVSFSSNTAAMAVSGKKLSAEATYSSWNGSETRTDIAGISGYGNIRGRFAVGAFGYWYRSPAYRETNENGTYGDTFRPSEYYFGISAASRILDGLAAGVNLKMAGSSLAASASAKAFAADIYAFYRLETLSVGAGVTNIGTGADYGYGANPIPTTFKAGAAYRIIGIGISAEADYVANSGFMCGAGLSYDILGYATVRAGYHYGGKSLIPSYIAAGASISLAGVRIDASVILSGVLQKTFSVGVGYDF